MPLGAKKSTYLRKSPKWIPKKWKPAYGTMVLLSVQGLSNKDIGDKLGYSEQQISNILNCSEAKKMKERIAANLEKDMMEDTAARLQAISRRSVHNIERVIFNDSLLENAPLAIFDRSERFLKAVGTLKDPESSKVQQNNIFIGNDIASILAEGLMKANRVNERHQIQLVDKVAEDLNRVNEIVVEKKPLELKP